MLGLREEVDLLDVWFASNLLHTDHGQWDSREANLQLLKAKTRGSAVPHDIHTMHGTSSTPIQVVHGQRNASTIGPFWRTTKGVHVCG